MPTSKSSGAVYAPAQEDSFDLGWLTPNSKLMKKKKTSLLQMVLSKKALCSLPSTAEGKWKQRATKETTVQTGMVPQPKDNRLERKLSTKPNQNKSVHRSQRQAAQTASSTTGNNCTGRMDTKSTTTEPGIKLGKCEYSRFQKQAKSPSGWLLNDHCEMTWSRAQLLFSIYSEV